MQLENRTAFYKFIWAETVKSACINSALNLGMAYYVFRSSEPVGFWGPRGLFIDITATLFLMPFLMTLIMTKVITSNHRKNRSPPCPRTPDRSVLNCDFLPEALPVRAIFAAVMALLTILPPVTAVLVLWGQFPMPFGHVVIFKAVFGGLLAAVLTPVIIGRAAKGESL